MSEPDDEYIEWGLELCALKFADPQYDDESGDEAADRINNLRISPIGTKLSEYIQGLYESGAKIWTKDMFLEIEKELAEEPRPSFFMTRSMNDEWTLLEVTGDRVENCDLIPSVEFTIYQRLLFDAQHLFSEQSLEEHAHLFTREIDTELTRNIVTCALYLEWRKRPNDVPMGYSFLQEIWAMAQENWINSPACADLIEILRDEIEIPKSANKIVCFGLGNLDDDDFKALSRKDGEHACSSMTQHAAALTMAAVLGEALDTGPLPVLVQDPCYSPMSTRLLTELGIEVVGGYGSLGFTLVDEDTIVFSCHAGIPVKQIVADIAKPAVMVWDRVTSLDEERVHWEYLPVDGFLQSPWVLDEDSPRTRAMIEDYAIHDFPIDEDRFGDLEIYVRKD